MALGDALLNLLGNPDPRLQLMQRFGQAPGQPGSPAPLAAPGGGGAPPPPTGTAPPAGPQGAPAGPGGPPPAQPQPQAYQSPPDLGQMYLQLVQRQQQASGIDRGLGALFSAMAKPVNKQAMLGAFGGDEINPAGLVGNIMQINGWTQQQQRLQQIAASLPALAQQIGIPLSALQAMYASNPEGIGAEIARIEESKLGLTGDVTTQQYNRERNDWIAKNSLKDAQGNPATDANGPVLKPGAIMPDNLENIEKWKYSQIQQATEAKAKTDDLVAARRDFAGQNQQFNQAENLVAGLLDKNTPLDEVAQSLLPTTGVVGAAREKFGGYVGAGLSAEAGQAAGDLQQLKNILYSKAFQSTGSRRTQQEVANLSAALSQLDNVNLKPGQLRTQLGNIQTMLRQTHANAFGAAGQTAPEDYYNVMDPIYKPKGDLFAGASPGAKGGFGAAAPGGGRIKTYNPATGQIE